LRIVLAVKLHFKKRPFIGKGSYWIPVTTWNVARDQIRKWLHLLTSSEGGTGRRSYITLAKIPDDHLVWMGIDWIGFDTERPVALREVPGWIKAEIMTWYDHKNQHFENCRVGSKNCYAQVRLEQPLPPRYVKWTKDLRLLHRGDKRRRSRTA